VPAPSTVCGGEIGDRPRFPTGLTFQPIVPTKYSLSSVQRSGSQCFQAKAICVFESCDAAGGSRMTTCGQKRIANLIRCGTPNPADDQVERRYKRIALAGQISYARTQGSCRNARQFRA